MVSEVFPHLCEKSGVPRRADWAEWNGRFFVVPDKRSPGLRGTLAELCCAVMEYALGEGLSAVGGVQENLPYASSRRTQMARRTDGNGKTRK